MNEVTVLLATYNGEKYLEEQIVSLLNQKEWTGKILARDDNSSDSTHQILRKYSGRVDILPTNERLGAVGNFSALMTACQTPYMMFCDQDDVWKPDKILVTYQEMKKLETLHGSQTPLLVHTDLEVVDTQLNPIAPSYWKYAHLYPHKTKTLNRFLMQNVVSGCTTMLNQALAQKTAPIPSQAAMHDWWTALVASAIGKIGVVDQPTILYRQHQKNTLGAQPFNLRRGFAKLFGENNEIRKQNERIHLQAQELIAYFNEGSHQHELIEDMLRLPSSSSWETRYILLRRQLLRQGFWRNAATLLFPKR